MHARSNDVFTYLLGQSKIPLCGGVFTLMRAPSRHPHKVAVVPDHHDTVGVLNPGSTLPVPGDSQSLAFHRKE